MSKQSNVKAKGGANGNANKKGNSKAAVPRGKKPVAKKTLMSKNINGANRGKVNGKKINAKKVTEKGKNGNDTVEIPSGRGWPVSSTRPSSSLNYLTESDPFQEKDELFLDNQRQDDNDDATEILTENDENKVGPRFRLRPGPTLQKCSGSDIQLSKSATAKPNMAKGIGRFLFILPGLLSFTKQNANLPTNTTVKRVNASAHSADNCTDNELDTMDTNTTKEQDEDEEGDLSSVASSKTSLETNNSNNNKMARNPNTVKLLGTVQNLNTPFPKLILPFPDDTNTNDVIPNINQSKPKQLVFKGRKIKCSSKFMALTYKGYGGGSVSCKDIFEDVIVFGDVGFCNVGGNDDLKKEQEGEEGIDLKERVIQGGGDEKGRENDKNVTVELTVPKIGIHHYGGSERTIDGGKVIRGMINKGSARGGDGGKKTNRNKEGAVSIPSIATNSISGKQNTVSGLSQKEIESIDSDDMEEEVNNDDNDDDDDDDEEFEMDGGKKVVLSPSQSSLTPRKRTPRRSATKKVKYSFQSESSEQEDSQSSEEEKEEDKAEKLKVGKTIVSKARKCQRTPLRSSAKKTKNILKIDSDEEDDEHTIDDMKEEEEADESNFPKKTTGKRLRNRRKNSIEKIQSPSEASHAEDENSETSQEEKKIVKRKDTAAMSASRKQNPRHSQAKKDILKKNVTKKARKKFNESESSCDDNSVENDNEEEHSKKQTPAARKRIPRQSKSNTVKYSFQSESENEDNESIESDAEKATPEKDLSNDDDSDDVEVVKTIRGSPVKERGSKRSTSQSSLGTPRRRRKKICTPLTEGSTGSPNDNGPYSSSKLKHSPNARRQLDINFCDDDYKFFGKK